jgi:hypothetical protein
MANRATEEGANLYLAAGSTTTYVLPAPPGYWAPATKCEVWREVCLSSDSACRAAAEGCKGNLTDNVNSWMNGTSSSSCKPTTFNQPCDWRSNPDLLGKTVDVLRLGPHDLDYPFACAAGVLGGNGSLTSQQTSAACAGLCPAGFTCGAQATVAPAVCPKSSWCAAGSSKPTACEAGKVGRSEGLRSARYCEACPMGSWCSTGLVIPCVVNTYQPAFNKTFAGACQQCPRFAESNESSTSVEDCKCQEGYYDSEPAADKVDCKPCPIGSECKDPGYTLAQLPLRPGYWRTNSDSSDLRRCPDASSPNTTACANTNGVICKPWTTGPYCRVCNVTDGSRYFDSGQSACVECGDTAATSLSTLIGTTLATLILLCWCGWRQPCKRLRIMAHQALQKIRAPLKQMIAFYQVCHGPCGERVRSPLTPR